MTKKKQEGKREMQRKIHKDKTANLSLKDKQTSHTHRKQNISKRSQSKGKQRQ
jgi:hypothetical protein